jgi:cell division protein ZapA
MDRASVELRVGGQTYRVVGSGSSDELERLAKVVDGKLRELSVSSAFHPQSMLLVAMTLAHELEEERLRSRELEQRVREVEHRSREMLHQLVDRVDAALELVDEPAATPPPPPAHAES